MRIAHWTDTHVKSGPSFPWQVDALARFVERHNAARPDLSVHTGDVWGTAVPYRPSPAEIHAVADVVEEILKVCPLVFVVGNHDHGDAVRLLERINGQWPCIVVREPRVLEVVTPAGPCMVYPLPYVTRPRFVRAEEGETIGDAVDRRVRGLLRLWSLKITRRRDKDAAEGRPRAPHVFASHLPAVGVSASGTQGITERITDADVGLPLDALEDLRADVGLLGHVHGRHHVCDRVWHTGSLWVTEHGPHGRRAGWSVYDVAEDLERRGPTGKVVPAGFGYPSFGPEGTDGAPHQRGGAVDAGRLLDDVVVHEVSHGRGRVRVTPLLLEAPGFVTLRYRWAARDGGDPSFVERPDEEVLADVPGAVVRMIVTMPAELAGSDRVAWGEEVDRVRALGPYSVDPSRKYEPKQRTRNVAIREVETIEDKCRAWSDSLSDPLAPEDLEVLLESLAELRRDGDDVVAGRTDLLVHPAPNRTSEVDTDLGDGEVSA